MTRESALQCSNDTLRSTHRGTAHIINVLCMGLELQACQGLGAVADA